MESMSEAVISLAEKHLGYFRVKNGQVIAEYCPFCKGHDKDKETFGIGLNNGLWQCLRGSCSKKGNFRQLCEFFGEQAPTEFNLPKRSEQQRKSYAKPDPVEFFPVTDEITNYLGLRWIFPDTIKDWKIMSDKDGNIVFPFYRNEELVYVKYRRPKKHMKEYGPKEWAMPNTEPILFGMDMVSFNKPLVITEGEIDALSIYEAGYSNVVSVPAGCNNLEWINICWEWLEKFNQFILFGDSDEAGQTMISTLTKRLGEDRCMIPSEYPECIVDGESKNRICKDANEILTCYGPEFLKNMVESCEPAPIKGVLDVSKIPFVDPVTVPRIMTNIPALNTMLGGLSEGGLTVISGKRGEGKSTLAGPFCLNAIKQGESVCAYSGELKASKFLEWIMLQATERKYIGYRTDPRSGKNIAFVDETIQRRIKDWLAGKFFLYDNGIITEEKQTESILRVFEACARRYGTKLFVCDNLMSALVSADEENKAQGKFTAQLKAFANKYSAHVIVVAHPRKTAAGSTFSNDDVSGNSAITNLADNVINVEKDPTKGIRVTKNRDFGTVGFINTCYDPASRRIFQYNLEDTFVCEWDHTGISVPECPVEGIPEFEIDKGIQDPPV